MMFGTLGVLNAVSTSKIFNLKWVYQDIGSVADLKEQSNFMPCSEPIWL